MWYCRKIPILKAFGFGEGSTGPLKLLGEMPNGHLIRNSNGSPQSGWFFNEHSKSNTYLLAILIISALIRPVKT